MIAISMYTAIGLLGVMTAVTIMLWQDRMSPAFLMLIPWLLSFVLLMDSELYYAVKSEAYPHGKAGQLVKKLLFWKDAFLQEKRFRDYYKKHCHLSRLYSSCRQLSKEAEGDVFIVGSDQVWNEYYDAGRDPAYYLNFTECRKKMSYAASMGQLPSQDALIPIAYDRVNPVIRKKCDFSRKFLLDCLKNFADEDLYEKEKCSAV